MAFLLPVLHAGQAFGSIYAATYSVFAISNLQNREEQTKRAAQYSNTAAHQLHKTRTTQTSGALATLSSLISGVVLAASLTGGTTSLGLSAANTLGLAFAYSHLTNFWQHKVKVPFVNDYNDGIRASNNLRQSLAGLAISWAISTCFYAWQALIKNNMDPFVYNANPGRVVFGPGSINKLPEEIKRLGLKAPLLLSTPQQVSQVEDLANILKSASIEPAGIYSNATMHTPSHITDEALSFLHSKSADVVVSIGGGSTTGLGKAISIRTGLPHISIPTTYAGSEMTPILGETQDGRKTTRSDPKILPGVVIYDVDLTMTLPGSMSATSGVNAIAHAVEALYAQNKNPIISLLALEGTKALAESLPEIIENPSSQSAREKAQYGAWLCGVCLGSSSMALHHKLCHTLGGSFNLPHAETHTIVLPHALSYNAPAIPDAMAKLASALPGSDGDATKGLNLLLGKLKVKRALKDYGMKEEDIDKAAEIAVSNQYPNPRKIEKGPIRELIRRAWAGEDARADL